MSCTRVLEIKKLEGVQQLQRSALETQRDYMKFNL
jgi:hypothetical protein